MPKHTFELPKDLSTATHESWRKLVDKALGPRSFSSLTTKTLDGITIKPLYNQQDTNGINTEPLLQAEKPEGARPWEILQLIDIPSLNHANKQMKVDLKGGASGLMLSISADIPYASGVLPLDDQQSFEQLFQDIDLTNSSVHFTNGTEGLACAAALMNYLQSKDQDLSAIKGNLSFDPLSLFAALGTYPDPSDEALDNWIDAAHGLKDLNCAIKPFKSSGRTWQQAGASEAMELAFSLATALYYVRILEASGFTAQEAFDSVDISLVANSDIFISTAKFRAMRILWQKVASASGQSSSMQLTGEMSYLDLTERDPEVNMLRATVATVAAGLGNLDGLVLLPFSSAHGIATSAARRLCLNTQIIAQEESYIGTVEDPAAGSWYVESLTNELAEKAWDYFRQTEKAGGIAKMLRAGHILTLIEPVRTAKEQAIATGKKAITGVTAFPNINEQQPGLYEMDDDADYQEVSAQANSEEQPISLVSPEKGQRFNDICAQLKTGRTIQSFDEVLECPSSLIDMLGCVNTRLVSSFEGLRSVSDYIKVETGQRPSVFLANVGNPSDFTARATWAKSFFEAGGIEGLTNDGFASNQEMINSFATSDAKIVCLCSSDEIYTKDAISLARALTEAGANAVYMVARPKLLKTIPSKDRGAIHALLYQGTNMVSTLMEAHYLIGFEDDTLMV